MCYYEGKQEGKMGLVEFWHNLKCVDCGFWFSRNDCRACSRALCGVCVAWPSPHLHSPGKGMCSQCRQESSQRFTDNPPGFSKIWQIVGLSAQEAATALTSAFGTIPVMVCENEEQDAQLTYATHEGMVIGYPEMADPQEEEEYIWVYENATSRFPTRRVRKHEIAPHF